MLQSFHTYSQISTLHFCTFALLHFSLALMRLDIIYIYNIFIKEEKRKINKFIFRKKKKAVRNQKQRKCKSAKMQKCKT